MSLITTHTSELLALMAQGKDWHGGLPLAQVPFVLLDFENRERTLRDRVRNYLGDDLGRIRELFLRVPALDLPRPLTTDTIEIIIKRITARISETGTSKGVVIIDTFRTAFGDSEDFDENDQSSVGKIMRPLKALAMATKWCIIVLHHNAKSTDRYSGAGTLASVADYLWNWKVDKEKLTGTLSCEGRADAVLPLKFAYDLRTKRNIYLGTNTEIKEKSAQEDQREDEERTLGCFRKLTEETSITTTFVAERLEAHERTARRKCQDLFDKGLLQRVGDGKRGNNYKYWLSQEGEKRLFLASVKLASTANA